MGIYIIVAIIYILNSFIMLFLNVLKSFLYRKKPVFIMKNGTPTRAIILVRIKSKFKFIVSSGDMWFAIDKKAAIKPNIASCE